MLKGCNDDALRAKGVDEVYIPFYQIWQELVHFQTLDVYQYRINNSFGAISELIQVIENTLDELYNTNDNIECCREETLYTIKKDDVLEKYEKPLWNRMLENLGKKPSTINKQKALMYQLKYCLSKLENKYLDYLILELKTDVETGNIGKIEKHSNDVISQCIHAGWSSRALFFAVRHLRNANKKDDAWISFAQEIKNKNNVFFDVLINVFFRSKNPTMLEETLKALDAMGIIVKNYDELMIEFSDLTDIKTILNSNKKYIQVVVEALDIYSAAHLALKQLSDKMTIASFYNLTEVWDIRNLVIVPINKLTKYHKPLNTEDLYKTYDYLDSSSKIFESTRNIFSNKDKKNIQDKLQGAFSYSNISRASLFQEEKYINSWIAIESLARNDMYSNIISNVKEILPAALCSRYIYRLVRNYAEDCLRCNISFCFSSIEINLRQDTKRELVKEIISALNNDIIYNEIIQKCQVNSLLKHRTECIKQLVSDIKYSKEKIENHYKKVKWQIQRLYRIRNEIAHSALKEETYIIIYIEHLYDYLSTFISEIVTLIEDKKLNSLEEVYCVIVDNYNAFIELSKSQDNTDIKDRVLSTGIIDLVV